jgi:predicted metalloprotease with PDZ domain
MRAMNAEFGLLKKGYTKADFIRICEEMYGGSLQDFFHKYVETSADISADLQGIIALSGSKFEQDPHKGWTLIDYNVI